MAGEKVYSYLRFSDVKQATGGSIDRQRQYAQKWAAENGMVLDDSLSMRDEGLSAFHQKHIKSGALGVFLEAVNAGNIPTGSVLIVEGLDRLSRAEPILAQAQLAQIINAGITVVTASDGKRYSREQLKANPMDLVYSLLVMIRAHEESDTKSKRVKAAVRRQCEDWVSGKRRARIVNGRDPGWVRWNGDTFELVPERAGGMRLVVDLFLKGYGFMRIAQELKKNGLVATGEYSANWIYSLIQRPDLIGVRRLKTDGEEYRLENYYPRLISDEDFARLQLEYERRRRAPRAAGGKSKFPGFFTGISVGTCGHCNVKLISNNQTRRLNVDGTPAIYRRLVCPLCSAVSAPAGSISAWMLEKAILDYCSDQFNIDALTASDNSKNSQLLISRGAILERITSNEKKLKRLVDLMFAEDNVPLPGTLVEKMRELEAAIAQDKSAGELVAAEISLATETPSASTAKAWADLRAGVLALDYDSRIKARQMLAETFAKVEVFFRGIDPLTDRRTVNVLLTSKTGAESRLITIDRKTGEVVTASKAEIIADDENYTAASARILRPAV